MAKQNIYDDEEFFAGYQGMREARSGINEAVEQPALRSLLPDVTGRAVVDLGCGDGQLCRDLAERGAASVLGIDPSARMLALAGGRTSDPRIAYRRAFAEDVELPGAGTDVVVSSLALHYVADLPLVLGRVTSWLVPGGWFIASVEHPVVTAAPHLGRDPCVVDDYADEGRREVTWYAEGVIKHHRRVSTILNAVIDAGLILQRVLEPTPTAGALAQRPDLDRHRRRPSLLLLAATKPSTGWSTAAP